MAMVLNPILGECWACVSDAGPALFTSSSHTLHACMPNSPNLGWQTRREESLAWFW